MEYDGETLFSKIARGEIPANIVFENETVLAFRDLNPQAPQHILIIPRKKLAALTAAEPEDRAILGDLLLAAGEIARAEGFSDEGYRVVINSGDHGGQTVYHLHVHLLGGRSLAWPPG